MSCSIYVGAILTNREGEILLLEEEGLNRKVYFSLPYAMNEGNLRLDEAVEGEIRNRLGMECELEHLLGIYAGFPVRGVLCFMFKARHLRTRDLIEPRATWMSLERVRGLRDEEIVNSAIVKSSVEDYAAGKRFDLGLITNWMYGKGLKA